MNQHLIVLTSPPASGKTYWISSLKSSFKEATIMVISPLRALADECRNNWGESIIVVTPEEWMISKRSADIIIYDEFHLFFYWGDTFRPLMWEMFFELSQNGSLTFLLTATLNKMMKEEIAFFNSQFDEIIWIDQGNQLLKYRPLSYIKAPSKKWIISELETEPIGRDVKLIFCKYRQEVMHLNERLTEKGYQCVTCIGGESKEMAIKLKKNPKPDFIISTTVLSHGVNLPPIKKIYFTYQVENKDFWIQMVARGGRRGDEYRVFALERPFDIKWNFLMNALLTLCLSLKHQLYSFRDSFDFQLS